MRWQVNTRGWDMMLHFMLVMLASTALGHITNDVWLELPTEFSLVIFGYFVFVPILAAAGLHWCLAQLREHWGRDAYAGILLSEGVCIMALLVVVAWTAPNPLRFIDAHGAQAGAYWKQEAAAALGGSSQIHGRAVIVYRRPGDEPKIAAYLMSELPRSIRAEEPEEVQSVIKLAYTSSDGPQPIETCRLTIIDRESHEQTGSHEFVGQGRMVQFKNRPEPEWRGTVESYDIREYLKVLPRE